MCIRDRANEGFQELVFPQNGTEFLHGFRFRCGCGQVQRGLHADICGDDVLSLIHIFALFMDGVSAVPIYGGASFRPQLDALRRGVQFAVSYTHLDVYKRQQWSRQWRRVHLPALRRRK